MASRYWVSGGNGNFSSTTNWSATTGGASGASVPTSADDVFVNGLSGTSPIITVDTTSLCLNLDFTGAITPTLAGASLLSVYSSLTLISAMTITYNNLVTFRATATGKTITTAGKSLPFSIAFDGVGGGWTLQDNLTGAASDLTLTNGALDTNGKTVTISGNFNISNSNTRTLTFGSSVITVSGAWTATTTTGLTFNPNTSTIIMAGTTRTFNGGGLTYNNVSFTGTPLTIAGSNTFNILTYTAGKTVNITAGTNQTYASLVANGTPASKITIQSTSAGSAATMTRTSGIQVIRNITLKDITATGGATFYALGTTNVSGNTGWAYQMLIKQEKLSGTEMALYHIDSTGTIAKVSG